MRPISAALFFAMFLLVSHSQGSAQAYLDPNTGSMFLQLLLAGVVGVLATVRLYWYRLKTYFVRRPADGEGVSEGR
jgi:opacity protein-like surface antigen